ncbi:phosphonoacetaldehyde reductase [Shewanella algae]|nr:phosphonoacetaldehyde reductase [Shewanella algae]WKC41531.1 phosphonoacetaldehyde reductase [Shewanella algae]
MYRYHNPVEIITGLGALRALESRVAQQDYVLLTHPGQTFTTMAERVIAAAARPPLACLTDVEDNPSLANLQRLCRQLQALPAKPALLLALGGGSVIDACKVLCATGGDFDRLRAMLNGTEPVAPLPYIAIPTTSGTGSEVTCWATVWDPETQRKHSLAHPALYARSALLEPELTLSLPLNLSISTALDALSHALESLWNHNRNPLSSQYAVRAAQMILSQLPRLKLCSHELALRETLQLASLFAGLAFSNTKTSLAHNISYRVTLEKGVSHGQACSFTLPMIIRAMSGDTQVQPLLEQIFGCPPLLAAERLEQLLLRLGIDVDPRRYGYRPQQWLALVAEAADGQRGRNFSGDPQRLLALYQQSFQMDEVISCQK